MRTTTAHRWDTFDPIAYRHQHYGWLRDDDRQILALTAEHLAAANLPPDSGGLDVGTGPNLSPALTMLPWCQHLTLWERSAPNVAWLRGQLEHGIDGEVWRPAWEVLVDAVPAAYKPIINPGAALAHVATVEAGSIHELPEARWDVGTMYYVAESITDDPAEFRAGVRAFVRSLRPGAPFAAAFMTGSTGYEVSGAWFPAVPVDAEQIREALTPVAEGVVVHPIASESPVRDGVGMALATGYAQRRPRPHKASSATAQPQPKETTMTAERIATATQPTTAVAHTGKGFTLPAGTYPVVEIDGATERGVNYIKGPGGGLCAIDQHDPNITIAEEPLTA